MKKKPKEKKHKHQSWQEAKGDLAILPNGTKIERRFCECGKQLAKPKPKEKKEAIKACENCPSLGNHYHYNGQIVALPNDKNEVEIMEFSGIREIKNKEKKEAWGWEERFKEISEDRKQDPDDIYIKAFIRQLLSEKDEEITQERKKVVEEIWSKLIEWEVFRVDVDKGLVKSWLMKLLKD